MMQTVRPPTVPTPVTTPSAGVSVSWLRAKSQSSWNSVPGSRSSFSRSRTKSLPSARSLDVGIDLGHVAAHEAKPEAHGLILHHLGRQLELSLSHHRPPFRRPHG